MTEATPGRGKNGKYARTLDTAERDAEAARLRARGLGLREIGEHMGYADASGAYRAVNRALDAVPVEAVEELRALECARLDMLTEQAWAIINGAHLLVAPGGKVVHGDDGQAVADPMPALRAIAALLKISERRARLLGLDAAKKYEFTGGPVVTLEAIDLEIARMQREINEHPATFARNGSAR